MDKKQAQEIVKNTFENPFDKDRFISFVKNLLNSIEEAPFSYRGNLIPDAYEQSISMLERIGKYTDGEHKIDILVVKLKKETSIERARTMQRNFIAWYLNGSRGGEMKDAALVAFVSPDEDDWRFSLVKMDYRFVEDEKGRTRVKEEFTPARRWSFLVGKNENSHTAKSQLVPIIEDDEHNPTLAQLEDAFNIEKVTREFFEKYRELFLWTKETLDKVVTQEAKISADFSAKGINPVDFAKKLLGQIVFLYFLQKKGWFGVKRDANWGTGPKNFLRELFEGKHDNYNNFFNDILEPLFYQALRNDRRHDDDYYDRFKCKIPFLNGGLFDPIGGYDWVHTDILLPNELFSNSYKTKEGDTGNGILDIFDRYNFTVKEDEPLEKEVAVDPEMLGKVFENLLEVKDRKSKGTYYTPREIVNYMCQQSLINYLATELDGKVSKDDCGTLIKYGEQVSENEARVEAKGRETDTYSYKLSESIRANAKLIDEKLANIKVCDPAIGSGAFPVGMMSEIVKARNTLTTYLNPKNVILSDSEESKLRNIYNFKRECIEKSLYGVDIDLGAVEIAKLRLWLSLVVDEEDYHTIKPLPNLDYKIVCGNSLLGVEKNLFNNQLFTELERLKPLLFNETGPKKKQEYKNRIDDLISQITNGHKEFDFKVYFSEVFHEKKGFDVVIANPPYISALEFSSLYGPELREKLNSSFHSAKGTYDIFVLFIERGIELNRIGGILTYITPNKYLSAKYASALREYILRTGYLSYLVDLSSIKVFEEASVYPVISCITREVQTKRPVSVLLPKNRHLAQFQVIDFYSTTVPSDMLRKLPEFIWGFLLSNNVDLLSKIINATDSLETYGDVNATSTAGEAETYGKFITNESGDDSIKVLNTGTIDRYASLWGIHAMVHAGQKFLTPYLPMKKASINSRRRNMYKAPKIIFAKMAKECEAYIDVNGEYASVNTNCFCNPKPDISLKFIGAFCNSKLFMFIYEQFFGALRMSGGYYQFQAPQLRIMPLKRDFLKQQAPIIEYVNQILAAKQKDPSADTSALEREIDQIVYKLYGLTEEEIAIVEESVGK